MTTVEKHAPGSFCWVELSTSDGDGAKKFYTDLFGWAHQDDEVGGGMVYTMLQRDEKNVGALFQMGPDMQSLGIPPHWLTYVTVESVDDSVAKTKALGGTVVREPMDVLEIGRMAVIQDPEGATIAFWQPKMHHGFQVCGEDNTHCWSELWTNDTEACKTFYSELFGWTFKEPDKSATPYTELLNAGTPIGGMMKITPEMGGTPPSWLNYFSVEDCDAIVKHASDMGARSLVPAMDIPEVGRFSVMMDPQGAVFAVIHLTRPM